MSRLIHRLNAGDAGFEQQLSELLDRGGESDRGVEQAVADIIADVRTRGDIAVLEYTQRFDRVCVADIGGLRLDRTALTAALDLIGNAERAALQTAADRIRRYAEQQKLDSWSFEDESGNTLGQRVSALDRVGLYVPGGKAAYPSSVLMNAIPARVAGVRELIMVVPTPGGEVNPMILAAAAIAGVDVVFKIGGAQAVAALAYGTESIPAVDKIVGPGNIYVATAKRMVFGQVGIDMIAGPSEIVIVADANADPEWLAMDLFSQAEHDELAQAILISPERGLLDAVQQRISAILPSLQRRDIVAASLHSRGALIATRDMQEAFAIVNRIAPEHLELALDDADSWVAQIRHAGAIFIGHLAAEVLGDYVAGPNHVLPTAGTARFASPLGVYDFQKRSSIIRCSPAGADMLAATAECLARSEGLDAHARSAGLRRRSS